MNLRLLCALFVAGTSLAPVTAAEPASTRTATAPLVAFEVRVVRVSAEPGAVLKAVKPEEGGVAFLSDEQLKALFADAQSDPRANILCTPKVVASSGEPATVRVGSNREFVTGLEARQVKGSVALVAKKTVVELGDVLTVCGSVSADRRSVSVSTGYTNTSLASDLVPLVPVTTQTPAMNGGPAIPFTQFLQAPQVRTIAIEKKELSLPSNGHVVITGPVTTVEERTEYGPPVLSNIPYLGRLFKSVAYFKREVRTLLVVSARVVEEELPVAPAPRSVER